MSPPMLDLRGATQDLDLFCDRGRGLANSDAWPAWKPGAESTPPRGAAPVAAR